MFLVLILVTYVPLITTFSLNSSTISNSNDQVPPGRVNHLQVIKINAESVELSFVSPGDDGEKGKVLGYDIRYYDETISNENEFDLADVLDEPVDPAEPGETVTFTINDLDSDTQYWIAIKAFDEVKNTSVSFTLITFTTTAD